MPQKIFNFLEQSHIMRQLRTPVYIYLLIILNLLLFSCAKKESRKLINHSSTDTSEYTDPYWQHHTVGTGKTEAKQQLVKKFNTLLVFHANDTMQVNKAYVATLALAKNTNLEELKAKVLDASDASDNNAIVDTTIHLGKRMKAKLVDMSPRSDPSFYIEEMGDQEQNLNSSKEAYWNWKIEPLKEGEHELKLSIQVILSDDDRINLPPRDIKVTIFAQKVSVSTEIGNFFSNYWQWIITGILIPIFIAWLTSRIKQANDGKKK